MIYFFNSEIIQVSHGWLTIRYESNSVLVRLTTDEVSLPNTDVIPTTSTTSIPFM